jgi:hypothetical protein
VSKYFGMFFFSDKSNFFFDISAGNFAGRRASDGNANLHIFYQTSSNASQMGNDEEMMMMTDQLTNACHQLKAIDANMESSGEDSSNDEIQV